MTPLVSIIVVTYNAKYWTERCLATIADQIHDENLPYELIIFYNSSIEYGSDELRRWSKGIGTIVLSGSNLGFGRACNAAVKQSSGEFVFLLNPDAIVQPHTIANAVEFYVETPDIGIAGGKVLNPDGSPSPGSCWGTISIWSSFCFATGLSKAFPRSERFNSENIGDWDRNTPRDVGTITGCLLLASRSVWDRLGGFNERFFMYGEDVDLCQRARRAGYRTMVTPSAVVIHASGASASSSAAKQIMLYKGKVTVVNEKYSYPLSKFATLLLVVGVLNRRLVQYLNPNIGEQPWTDLWRSRKQWSRGW